MQASTKVSHGPVDVGVVTDDERVLVNGNGRSVEPCQELPHRRPRALECFGSAVDDHELTVVAACHPPTQEASVIGLVVQDVGEALRRVLEVTALRIDQPTVGRDPEHELGIPVRKFS